jgi:ABC-type sugar transport system ATPase subunit
MDQIALHISIRVDEKAKALGRARKQMVEIVKALTFEFRILIMDEPTASLTQQEVDVLFAIIRDLRKHGVSIVYISYRLEKFLTPRDRVTVIRDGRYISMRDVSATNKGQLVADIVDRNMDNYYPKA